MRTNDETYQEIKQQFHKNSKNQKNEILYIILGILVLSFILFQIIARKSYEYIENINNLEEPIQIPTSGGTSMIINGETINVNFLAEYDIKGRVLAIAQYGDNIFQRAFAGAYLKDSIIRDKDVGLGRGFLSQDDYVNRFDRISFGRTLYPEWKSYEDYLYIKNSFSGENINRYINNHMSHNHLIPANKHIKVLLHRIRKGQYIHIKGYLVGLQGNKGYHLISSLTREDMGDCACETIYVTDITWLKQKRQ